jgi:hypothetical protein
VSTDAIRRFYVADHRDERDPHIAIVDRTGFLKEKRLPIGIATGEAMLQQAREVAQHRNECEVAGEHIFVMTEQGGKDEPMRCERCDATARPDVEFPDK